MVQIKGRIAKKRAKPAFVSKKTPVTDHIKPGYSTMPEVECPNCHKLVRLKSNGEMRNHLVTRKNSPRYPCPKDAIAK